MGTVEDLGLDLYEDCVEDDLEAASSAEQLDGAEEVDGGALAEIYSTIHDIGLKKLQGIPP